jgi:leucyl/phenylalanyl-tRNA---protein transferase
VKHTHAQKLFQHKRRRFPDPATNSIDGIVAMGDSLNHATLFEAYSFGIFPWPHEELPLLWYSPDPRGVLFFEKLHQPKSLRKFLKKMPWKVTFNKAFSEVMKKCGEVPRPGQAGTWIDSQMLNAYADFHKAGYAHSVEVWNGDKLVGGLYGVYVGGVFSGESMFYTESNASKVALIFLIERLKKFGLTWMDTQMLTPVTEQLGAEYISRDEFLQMLEAAKKAAKPLIN